MAGFLEVKINGRSDSPEHGETEKKVSEKVPKKC